MDLAFSWNTLCYVELKGEQTYTGDILSFFNKRQMRVNPRANVMTSLLFVLQIVLTHPGIISKKNIKAKLSESYFLGFKLFRV